MGTNFYKVLPAPEDYLDQIDQVAEDIKRDLVSYQELSYETKEKLDNLDKSKRTIHLGKRSCGWQFLWNHNNGEYYDVNIDSIKEFLESPGHIEDEYGKVFTVEQFFEEEIKNFLWGKDKIHNCNGTSYYKKYPKEAYYHYGRYGSVNIRGKEYEWSGNGDFLVNGLRFSDSTEFS